MIVNDTIIIIIAVAWQLSCSCSRLSTIDHEIMVIVCIVVCTIIVVIIIINFHIIFFIITQSLSLCLLTTEALCDVLLTYCVCNVSTGLKMKKTKENLEKKIM